MPCTSRLSRCSATCITIRSRSCPGPRSLRKLSDISLSDTSFGGSSRRRPKPELVLLAWTDAASSARPEADSRYEIDAQRSLGMDCRFELERVKGHTCLPGVVAVPALH